MVQYLHADRALLADGWTSNVRIGIAGGTISAIERGVSPDPGDDRAAVVMPGMPNLHSHAFQRGLAGLTGMRGAVVDSFWVWRELMYRFALTMTPEQVEVVASQAYMEMLEAGFTRVGEFHYLHHDRNGQPYDDIAEMATRIAAASSRTGTRLTLLPVLYAHGGFGGLPPGDAQRRFINDPDRFMRLVQASRDAVKHLDGAVVGVAPHSLRAVTPDELDAVVAMQPNGPIHIHVAEQQREVEDCLAWSGQRPVAWLLGHADVDERWCLVHATHMTGDELRRLTASGAVAGLCPMTEANLGDGIFAGVDYVRHDGRYGVGTDANTHIGVTDELRQLEYSQRLAWQARNVMATDGGSTGRALFEAARHGGQQALGVTDEGIVPGAPADFVTLEPGWMQDLDGDTILNAWIFGQGVSVDEVWVAGRRVVRQGRHERRDEIANAFGMVMRSLLDDGTR